MNKNIFSKIALMAGVALMGISCQTDYFNEHYLPGYEGDSEITNTQSMEFTLSADDYAAIAKNSDNKAIAEAAGEEAVAALSAISKNKYFANQDEAATYIPAWLAATYPTYDNGSLALITYTMALDIPEDVALMNAATEYTLTEDDYKTIWGSEEEYATAVTPKTVNKLKNVIPVADDAREGEYVVVTYNYSANEPATEEPETPEDPETPVAVYTSVLGTAALDDVVEVKGYISAMSTQGPILTDNSGSILLYKYTELAIGDEVTVNGTVAAYNCGYQFDYSKGNVTVEKTGTTTVTYPEPLNITGEYADELLTTRVANEMCYFAKMTGVLSISTNSDGTKTYYNFNIDGAETAVGSLYNPTEEIKAQLVDGMECTLYGYFTSISKTGGAPKYINLIVVSVNEAPAIGATNNYTSVLGAAVLDDVVEVKGYISAVSTQGPILTDNTGSIILYKAADLGLAVGDEVTVNGTIRAYNCGFQFDYSKGDTTVEKTGTTTVAYPAALDITGAYADELLTTRVENEYAYYAKMTGTVAVSGNYYNFNIPGAETAVGSIYGATDEVKSWLADGMECTLYGYFFSISKTGGAAKYINIIVTSVEPAASAQRLAMKVNSEKRYAYYKFNGTGYEAADIVAVQPADYRNMGQSYDNFTNPAQDNYLPLFLRETRPYAQSGDKVYLGYICRANSVNSWRVDEYVFDGEWVKTIYFGEKQDQFRKAEGVWSVDRTLELDYTNTSSADTKAFYQYCVNWVYDFKDVPMGAPARDNAGEIISTDIVTIDGNKPAGNYWVSNYGNNEFYTGASAYYGNVDWRPSAVKGGFAAAGMGDLSDDEILAKLKENTAEVYAEVLHYMYPEMTADQYKKVVVKVYCYGPNKNYSFTFDVVEAGKFAYVADSITEL